MLIDGNTKPKHMPCTIECIVDGDALSLSIAAASIVAKVTRDRMCKIMHCDEPQFGFDGHKGYSTPEHLEALVTARTGPASPDGLCALPRCGAVRARASCDFINPAA